MNNQLTLLVLLSAATLSAQSGTPSDSPAPEKFRLSVIGGATITNMPFTQPYPSDNEETNTDTDFGYFVGLGAKQPIKGRFSAILEAQFSTKGFQITSSPLRTRFQFHYLDVIPQLEYKAYRNLHVSVGGYWGRRLEERFKESDGNWQTFDNKTFEYAKDHDFGFVAGLSIRYKRLSGLLRYQHGVNLLSEGIEFTDASGETVNRSQRNRTLMVGIGFNIL